MFCRVCSAFDVVDGCRGCRFDYLRLLVSRFSISKSMKIISIHRLNKILCFLLLFFENQLQQIWKTALVSSKNQKKTRFLRILHDHCNHNIMDNISVHANPHVFRKHLMQLTDTYTPHAFFEIYSRILRIEQKEMTFIFKFMLGAADAKKKVFSVVILFKLENTMRKRNRTPGTCVRLWSNPPICRDV